MAKAPSIPVSMCVQAVCASFIWALQRMLQGHPVPEERQDPFPPPLGRQRRSKLLLFSCSSLRFQVSALLEWPHRDVGEDQLQPHTCPGLHPKRSTIPHFLHLCNQLEFTVSYYRDFFCFLTVSIRKNVLLSSNSVFAFLSPFSSLCAPLCRTACTNLSCSSTPSVTTNSSSIPPSFSSSTRKIYLLRRSRSHL